MSKAYEMISESLNEIIRDLEETCGKNLKREVIATEKTTTLETAIQNKSYRQNSEESFTEPMMNC